MNNDRLHKKRLKHEPPTATSVWGWRYHHLGIIYTNPKKEEFHNKKLKIFVQGFESSPYGIEWVRYEDGCLVPGENRQVPEIMKILPHLAFEVDNLEDAISNKNVLLAPGNRPGGFRVAFIVHNGAPIELVEFDKQFTQISNDNCMDDSLQKRLKHEPPTATSTWGWRYHHLGIPYTQPMSGETYYEQLKMFVMGFETSPYGIEWVRFENDCNVPKILRNIPHVAFEVDDLDEALKGKDVLLHPANPSGGVKVAFIVHNNAPIELMEFDNNFEQKE